MPQCSVFGCKSKDAPDEREKGITFHRFPQRDSDLLRKWVVNMKRGDWIPSERSLLCSEHFASNCFNKTGQTVRLKEGAVPTIFGSSKKNVVKVTKVSTEEKNPMVPRKRGRPRLSDKEKEMRKTTSKVLVKTISFKTKGKRNVKKVQVKSSSSDEFTESDDLDFFNVKKERDDDYNDHVYSNEKELPSKRIRKPSLKIRIKQEQLSENEEDIDDPDPDEDYLPEQLTKKPRIHKDTESDTANSKKQASSLNNRMSQHEDIDSLTINSAPGGKDKIIQLSDNRMYFEFAVPKKKVILQLKPPNDIGELKTQNLEEVISSLKSRQMLSHSGQEMLESFGYLPEALLKVGTKDKTLDTHTEEVRKFATTLYVYSNRGYELLSTVFSLPDTSLIQKRLTVKGFLPGFTWEALEILKTKATAARIEKICSVMFDFVNLRRECVFDRSEGKWIGHVDIGGGQSPFQSDAIPQASEILMFTAVGIASEWKIPFGYFPVSRLSADELHTLVCEAIRALKDCGLEVRLLVCKGNGVTFNMAKLFGCSVRPRKFTEYVTYFPHPFKPQQRIHLIFSIPQCFKLLQNLLADMRVLRSSVYGIIRWRYFEQLFTENATKPECVKLLEPEHADFYHRLRILRLCAPSFSCTVSQAFEMAEEMNIPEFKGCESAGNFAADMYRAFDLLNSRNPVTSGEKQPITITFLAEQMESLTVIGQRLFALEYPSGKKVVGESRWMCVGLLAFMLKSVSLLACDLINEKFPVSRKHHESNTGDQNSAEVGKDPMSSVRKYVTTNRFNMDHFDMVLSSIQKEKKLCGDPSVADFIKGYKKVFSDYVRLPLSQRYNYDFDGHRLTVGQGLYSSNQMQHKSEYNVFFMTGSHYLTDPNLDAANQARCIIKYISASLLCTECMSLLLNDDQSQDFKSKRAHLKYLQPSLFLTSLLERLVCVYKLRQIDGKIKDRYIVEHLFCDYFNLCERTASVNSYHWLEEPQHIICLYKAIINAFIDCKEFCEKDNFRSVIKNRFSL